jgi:hypothetical protein
MLKRELWFFVIVIIGCADVIDAQEQKKIGILSGGFAESTSASTEAAENQRIQPSPKPPRAWMDRRPKRTV